MLTLVITAALVITAIFLLANTKMKTYDIMFVVFGIVFAGISIATGPIYGYHEKVLEKEIELVQLSDNIYVQQYVNNVYLYKYNIENDSDKEQSYKSNIIRDNVIETETENCVKPVLRKYVSKAKTGIFSFCWQEEVEYEFYVPIDAIEETGVTIN